MAGGPSSGAGEEGSFVYLPAAFSTLVHEVDKPWYPALPGEFTGKRSQSINGVGMSFSMKGDVQVLSLTLGGHRALLLSYTRSEATDRAGLHRIPKSVFHLNLWM